MSSDLPSKSQEGTKIARFMTQTGIILIKEFKYIWTLRCEYGAKLEAKTLIFKTAKSNTKIDKVTYEIKFEAKDSRDREDGALMDFEETEEFCQAIQFLHDSSRHMAGEERDYTEAIYSSQDSIQVGFYQDSDRNQQAFIKLGNVSSRRFQNRCRAMWMNAR